jgi:hypothetical protein
LKITRSGIQTLSNVFSFPRFAVAFSVWHFNFYCLISQMRSKIRSLISLIRLAGLAVAALAMWGFAAIAEEVLEKETYALDKSILLALRSGEGGFL